MGWRLRRAVQQEDGAKGPLLQNAQWGGWADSWVCEWSNPIEQAQGLPHSPSFARTTSGGGGLFLKAGADIMGTLGVGIDSGQSQEKVPAEEKRLFRVQGVRRESKLRVPCQVLVGLKLAFAGQVLKALDLHAKNGGLERICQRQQKRICSAGKHRKNSSKTAHKNATKTRRKHHNNATSTKSHTNTAKTSYQKLQENTATTATKTRRKHHHKNTTSHHENSTKTSSEASKTGNTHQHHENSLKTALNRHENATKTPRKQHPKTSCHENTTL